MPNAMNGDQTGWSAQTWTDIQAAAHAEAGRVRILQKVLPVRPYPGAVTVPADNIDLTTLASVEGETKPFMEISIGFPLRESEVNNEKDLKLAEKKSKLATKTIALVEDAVILQGQKAPVPGGVAITRLETAGEGLLGLAKTGPIPVDPVSSTTPNAYGENTFRSVADAIAALIANGQPGPYVLFLPFRVFADTRAPLPESGLATPADGIAPLVTAGFYGTGALPEKKGLLASLGGDPVEIAVRDDANVQFTQLGSRDGDFQFRVFERIQFVVRDPRSLVVLNFL